MMMKFVLPVVLLALGGSMTTADAAMGCRPGYTRDAMGRCHHAFNRFRHHDRFHAFKREHCTKVRTPNGSVKRCRI